MDNQKSDVFPAINLKSPIVIFFLIVLFPIFFSLVFFAYFIPVIWVKVLFLSMSIITLLIIIYSFSTKIIVDNFSVTKKSIFGSKSIRFNEIEKYGVFIQEPKSATPLSRDNYNKTLWFGAKMIYISKRKDYDPIFSFGQKGILKFHYFENTFDTIENRLHKK